MKRMVVAVTDMAFIRHIGKGIEALTVELDALPVGAPQEEVIALDKQISSKYQKLFTMLPEGAENDEPLIDLILAPDNVFWADVNREGISGADVDQWCHEMLNNEGETHDIAKLRLQFFFVSPTALDIYLDKYSQLEQAINAHQ